jgi:hypothetical protein
MSPGPVGTAASASGNRRFLRVERQHQDSRDGKRFRRPPTQLGTLPWLDRHPLQDKELPRGAGRQSMGGPIMSPCQGRRELVVPRQLSGNVSHDSTRDHDPYQLCDALDVHLLHNLRTVCVDSLVAD